MLASLSSGCVTRKEPVKYASDPESIKIDVRIKGDFTKTNPYSEMGDALSFNNGDRVFITSEDGTITYEYQCGRWAPTDNYFFRWGSEGLFFHASYPATAGSDYQNFALPANQSTEEKLSYSDYMVCNLDKIHNDGSGVLRFDMERRMAKVIYTVSSVEEGEAIKGFKINSPSSIASGSAAAETIMVTPFVVVPEGGLRGGNGTRYIALVVPSDERETEEQVSMVYKSAPLLFMALPAREAGKQYEYEIKVEGDKVSISDPVVKDWTEGLIPGGTAAPERRFHWFVKPDGTSDGSSWEKAMGPSGLRELLATTGDDKEKAAIYDNTRFHFAAGTYDLSGPEGGALKIEYSGYSLPVSITWDGGYSPSSTGTSLSDRDITGFKTIITGGGAHPILQLGNQTSMSFDGITFENALSAGKGAALYQAPGSSGNSAVVLRDCQFLSNKGSSGAAICSNKGSVSCVNCLFSANEASGNGGAIAFAGGSLSLESCSFIGNNSGASSHTVSDTSDGKGGALWLHASAAPEVVMHSCVFSSNMAGLADSSDSKEYGGAIAMKNADVSASSCQFTANRGNRGSALMMLKDGGGLFRADHCSFYGNFQYSRGVCYILSKNVAMFNQSAFFGNDLRGNSSTWGEAVQGSGTTAICMNNCSLNSTKASYGSNTAVVNTDGALLLTSNTVIGAKNAWTIRTNTSGTRVLVNNIILNLDSSKMSYSGPEVPAMDSFNMLGANNNPSSMSDTDYVGNNPALSWSADAAEPWKSWFVWTGSLPGYNFATQSAVTTALDTFELDPSSWGGKLASMDNIGKAFRNWLEEMTPAGYSVNQQGTVRSSGYWPGSYQE